MFSMGERDVTEFHEDHNSLKGNIEYLGEPQIYEVEENLIGKRKGQQRSLSPPKYEETRIDITFPAKQTMLGAFKRRNSKRMKF